MRRRVEELGGTLTVESGPGEGTTVVAELPILKERRAENPAPADAR
jgi:signal transduction histidine kinase